ncbi:hypothetical protein TX25_28735 [Pseudomonas lactis]|uniref:hypothetical protein n=1 Tax=Pseudomonas lactis TaxID=1615674 RepID=UPI000712312A|nr:hypothetical protein [Pseudomonas lactis]KRP84855.1 hypothetical protein TX25_28735 [Pseudomonas lactis]
MSEVKRFRADHRHVVETEFDDAQFAGVADFDRVTAERDALQALLTAADERPDVLEGLIGEVLDAVGREPLDLDAVLRLRARMRAALKPAEAPRNQCDGCQAGIPLINGTHRMGREGGYPDFMGCSAKLYKPAEGGGDVARLALRPENQRITPARFKCLACGEYHEGSGNLPCPSMSPYSRIEQ